MSLWHHIRSCCARRNEIASRVEPERELSFAHICRLTSPIRLILAHTRFWLPMVILFVFILGISFVRAHAQAPSPTDLSNAMNISSLQRQVNDLGDVPGQMAGLRERLVALESKSQEQVDKLNEIASAERWAVMGILGMLASRVWDRLKMFGGEAK